MTENITRRHEKQLNAGDVAERLLPDLNMNELLMWAPDLFAYTSYIMDKTGTYQIVVSPPSGKKWAPQNYEIKDWLKNSEDKIYQWLKSFLVENTPDNEQKVRNGLNKWIFDPAQWQPHESPENGNFSRTNGYFSRSFVNNLLTDEKSFDEILKDIAKAIAEDVELSRKQIVFLEKDLKKIKFKRPELAEFFAKGTPLDEIQFAEEDSDEAAAAGQSLRDQLTEMEQRDGKHRKASLEDLFKFNNEHNWVQLVQRVGDQWKNNLNQIEEDEFFVINDGERRTDLPEFLGELLLEEGKAVKWKKPGLKKRYGVEYGYVNREKDILGIMLKHTPPLLLAVWAHFYNEITCEEFYGIGTSALKVSDLLCNQDHLQDSEGNLTDEMISFSNCDKLWNISSILLTMHAIADICCTSWGLKSVENEAADGETKLTAQVWAERLLFSKGSMATINPERARVIPKRHNPQVGITLRSISSNLAFHNSSVEVVWRKTSNTKLEERLDEEGGNQTISVLLIPYPFDVKSKDFVHDEVANKKVDLPEKYGFFSYQPETENGKFNPAALTEIVKRAKNELGREDSTVDAVVFPETALTRRQFEELERAFHQDLKKDSPSLFIAGVGESRQDIAYELNKRNERLNEEHNKTKLKTTYTAQEVNFNRNAVYCKYFDHEEYDAICYEGLDERTAYGEPFNNGQTPKYKQYKHHRWKLDASQISRYGLSQILADDNVWWESIKVPRRRVSFLNVGRRLTIANLICEDLARQDPIADLIRHVGPSLVITLLMDGPQLRNRWSSRYATILSDDPGSSVITLTSWGMVKRHIPPYGLMSRVVALWSESDTGVLREIELAEGAQAILLTLKLSDKNEKTADGREERYKTTVLRLKDVIQIYPEIEVGEFRAERDVIEIHREKS